VSSEHRYAAVLGPYVLGVLDEQEARGVEEHAALCEECRKELVELRELEVQLGTVPPESFLHGPPEDGDLLLQRTLRQMRGERASAQRWRSITVGGVVAASAATVFLGGYLVGGGPSGTAASPPTAPAVTAPTATLPPGVRFASAVDPATRARLTVRMTPSADWVRVNAAVTGIPAGEHCRLVVVDNAGHREIAGSWIVGRAPTGGGKGADLDGSAAVAAADVTSLAVEDDHGKTYVTAFV
jgi:anti-sigma factor RsiW